MNDQYPNSEQPSPIRTVMYAQRHPGEQPFAVTMDLQPYNGQPNERYETVRLVPAPVMATFGPTNPIGQPQHPGYLGWSNQHPADQVNLNGARPLAEQLNPRHEPARIVINGFTSCRKFLSGLIILLNLAITVTLITFILLFIFVSADNDEYNLYGGMARSLVIAFGLCLIFFRMLFTPLMACRMPITRNEKIATVFNVVMPQLKFHVFRLNPNFNGRMLVFYRQEWVMAIYEVILGISSIICYQNSYYTNTYNGYQYGDPIILLLAIFSLIDALFNFPCFLGIHGGWLKYRCNQ